MVQFAKSIKVITHWLNQKIELEKLFEVGYVDVDHIVPYSISFDDSFNNKVLVLSSENREKGNCLPLQYLRQRYGQSAADAFTVWVNNNVQNYRKKVKLLKKNITEQDKKEFKEKIINEKTDYSHAGGSFRRFHDVRFRVGAGQR